MFISPFLLLKNSLKQWTKYSSALFSPELQMHLKKGAFDLFLPGLFDLKGLTLELDSYKKHLKITLYVYTSLV
jgi:hypothetical protein